MAHMTLSFDPDVDDYDNLRGILDAAFGEADEPDEDEAPAAPSPLTGAWTLNKMRRYVKALAPTAQKALRAMAENAPEIDNKIVKKAAGLGGMEYAGAMSSFGHATRNTRGVQVNPFTRRGYTYYIDKHVAALALSALDEIGA